MQKVKIIITGHCGITGQALYKMLESEFLIYGIDLAAYPDGRNFRVNRTDAVKLKTVLKPSARFPLLSIWPEIHGQ